MKQRTHLSSGHLTAVASRPSTVTTYTNLKIGEMRFDEVAVDANDASFMWTEEGAVFLDSLKALSHWAIDQGVNTATFIAWTTDERIVNSFRRRQEDGRGYIGGEIVSIDTAADAPGSLSGTVWEVAIRFEL